MVHFQPRDARTHWFSSSYFPSASSPSPLSPLCPRPLTPPSPPLPLIPASSCSSCGEGARCNAMQRGFGSTLRSRLSLRAQRCVRASRMLIASSYQKQWIIGHREERLSHSLDRIRNAASEALARRNVRADIPAEEVRFASAVFSHKLTFFIRVLKNKNICRVLYNVARARAFTDLLF